MIKGIKCLYDLKPNQDLLNGLLKLVPTRIYYIYGNTVLYIESGIYATIQPYINGNKSKNSKHLIGKCTYLGWVERGELEAGAEPSMFDILLTYLPQSQTSPSVMTLSSRGDAGTEQVKQNNAYNRCCPWTFL